LTNYLISNSIGSYPVKDVPRTKAEGGTLQKNISFYQAKSVDFIRHEIKANQMLILEKNGEKRAKHGSRLKAVW
jgi:hypothetical protein